MRVDMRVDMLAPASPAGVLMCTINAGRFPARTPTTPSLFVSLAVRRSLCAAVPALARHRCQLSEEACISRSPRGSRYACRLRPAPFRELIGALRPQHFPFIPPNCTPHFLLAASVPVHHACIRILECNECSVLRTELGIFLASPQ